MTIKFRFTFCFRMKFTLSFLLLLSTGCLIDKTYGTTKKPKGIIGNLICRTICTTVCKRACPLCSLVCSPVCRKICSGKRSEVRTILVDIHSFVLNISLYWFWLCFQQGSVSYLLPCDFTAWDKNEDGIVDFEEFSAVGYPSMKEEDLHFAFQAIDTDGKSYLK